MDVSFSNLARLCQFISCIFGAVTHVHTSIGREIRTQMWSAHFCLGHLVLHKDVHHVSNTTLLNCILNIGPMFYHVAIPYLFNQ